MHQTMYSHHLVSFFFFNDTATTEIYTLSLHDALPICRRKKEPSLYLRWRPRGRILYLVQPICNSAASGGDRGSETVQDRKSTRLNSSHGYISYAVFCLKTTT